MKLVTLPNGMEIRDSSRAGARYVYDEIFVRECYRRHGVTVSNGDVIVDAGANVGLFSLWLSTQLTHATVYAFEPVQETADACWRNLERNAKQFPVALVPAGLSDVSGWREFTVSTRLSQVASVRPWGNVAKANQAYIANRIAWVPQPLRGWLAFVARRWMMRPTTQRCMTWRMTDFIAAYKLDRIDLLKIDTEGSEADILRSLSDDDWGIIRQVVVETHDPSLQDEVVSLLSERYDVAVEPSGDFPGLAMVYARLPEAAIPRSDREFATA